MMRKSLLIGIALLALVLAIPSAVCETMPPPGPPWPEEEWIPISPEDARPKLPDGSPMPLFRLWRYHPGGEEGPIELEPYEAFCLCTSWRIVVRSEAYDAETGAPVTACENIQDRSGAATAIWNVTFDESRLNPTYSYSGIGKWVHFENTDSSDPNDPNAIWYEAVAPLMLAVEHYYVFPKGLPAGSYQVHTELSAAGAYDNPIRIYDVTLVVS